MDPQSLVILLNFAIWLPLVGAGAIVLLPRDLEGHARWLAAGASLLALTCTLVLAVTFLWEPAGVTEPVRSGIASGAADSAPRFATHASWLPAIGANYAVGLDGLSLPMFVLNAFLVFIAVLVSWNVSLRPRTYFALVMVLETAVAGVFSSLDLFLFFLFWELELIPMYFLIGIWGGERREYAAMKFILYTIAGSAFMLIGILVLYFAAPDRSFDMVYLANQNYIPAVQTLAWTLLLFGFAVKIPIFPFHTWLPDAHTEAPTAISVLLAGVLLKMGAYGLIRINMGMLPEATRQFALILAILAITSIVYGAFVAMMQTDLKRVIANSSVSHMGYVVLGASALSPLGFEGAVFQMFTHGTITGLLFVMVGLVYDRTHTRTISDLGGLAGRMPFIATTFVAAGLASLGLPGLSGFVSELLVFLGAFPVWGLGTVLAVGTLIVTAGYVLWLLERVFFGPGKEQWARVRDASALERATVSALLLVIVLVGVLPGPLATVIIRGVAPIASRYLS